MSFSEGILEYMYYDYTLGIIDPSTPFYKIDIKVNKFVW